ncbi:hypothetical protein M404DRAFT_991236 [Pisolithus tinctorius Marx 270]|uniref:Uncharacterized protein n=1 Tax=Pisolithus tinctorius Marx 270 TaxID=870435 RepID=A0A0C3PYW7_PISTI|nr:hypothetical protein M404DRAFT_991236 [Pisolithus tinctorius Marx 270]
MNNSSPTFAHIYTSLSEIRCGLFYVSLEFHREATIRQMGRVSPGRTFHRILHEEL